MKTVMDIKEIALRIGEEADEYADAKLQSKGEFHPDWHTVRDEYFAEAIIAELAKQNEPVAINEPNYHYEAMGCGLEDRGITDRYEAMEYGWNCAIERMFEQLPKDPLYTFPPTAEQIANETSWQPIETAPKDGTVFLGYKLGQFRECYKVPRDDCDMWCFGGVSGADDLFPNIKPTHWMPLPTPPKRSMEGV